MEGGNESPVHKTDETKDGDAEKKDENNEQASTSSNSNNNSGSATDMKSASKRRNYRRRTESDESSSEDENRMEHNNADIEQYAEGNNQDIAEVEAIDNFVVDAMSEDESNDSNSSPTSTSDSSDSDYSFDSPLSPLLRFGINIRRSYGFNSDSSDTMDEEEENTENIDRTTTEIMNKDTPRHNNFSWPKVLMNRQRGFYCSVNESRYLNHYKNFERSFYGSLNSVERLELMSKLDEHLGCVNCLGFSKNGLYLLSGSDDLRVILWNWYNEKALTLALSKHKRNIFQTKFYDESDVVLKAISASADGTISIHQFLNDGGHTEKQIYTHGGAVHKVAVNELNNVIYTCGEDGLIIEFDYRTKNPTKLTTVREKHRKIDLFSITAHPSECKYAVSGKDQYVRVFDRRNHKNVLSKYCPNELMEGNTTSRYISCCVYNYNGTELLASYNDESIYLFESSDHTVGSYLHKYQGHKNTKTIKGVNFYGPKSEFIVTGSDCGHIFFFEKQSEAIVQFMKGDEKKTVNVLEPHPIYPVLATSGIDKDVKIWMPSNEEFSLDKDGLTKRVRKNISNISRNNQNPSFTLDPDIVALARRFFQRNRDPSPNHLPFVYRESDTSDDSD